MVVSPIYAAYAAWYEPTGQHAFATLMADHLPRLLARHPVAGKRLLDLACGTGTLAVALAQQGWRAVGIDQSAAMIRIAQTNAAGAAHFVQAQMQRPPVHAGAFDLVTCTFDSLNYLRNRRDLGELFAGAALALAAGGAVVLDTNTRHFLAQRWPAIEIVEHERGMLVQRASFDPLRETLTVQLTGFVADGEGYQRFDETHVERAFGDDEIQAAAAQAGLRIVAHYDGLSFDAPHATTDRVVWVLRRQDDDAADD